MLNEQEQTNNNNVIENDIKQLANHVGDRIKLSAAVRSAKVIGVLILTFIMTMMIMVVLTILSFAIAAALQDYIPAWAAYLSVAAIDLLLMILVGIFNRPLIIDPLISAMVSVLLDRSIKVRDIEMEQTRLALHTENDKIRLEKDLESTFRTTILTWVLRVLGHLFKH